MGEISLALRHRSMSLLDGSPAVNVVPAAARWPEGRAKHVCNLATWHDAASSLETSPELPSDSSFRVAGPSLLGHPVQDRLDMSYI